MRALSTLIVLMLALLAGCAGEAPPEPVVEEPVTVYSGRNENLIGPLLDRYRESTGREVEVRYGKTAELAATLLEEGDASPADVFISQDAAALGAVADAGMLRPLPDTITGRIPSRFQAPDGTWVGLSGRARAVVYNTDSIQPEDLPQSLSEVADEKYRGSFGIAPLNGSFQAHMAVVRAVEGEPVLAELLAGIAANEPRRYPKNSAIVEAVINGEVAWGLTNHYYLWRALAENPEAPARNFFMPDGETSSFVNVAGVGVLTDKSEAVDLVNFLVSDDAQRYFAEETFEYPLVASVDPATDLPPLAEVSSPRADFAAVAEVLPATLTEIRDSGLE
ncbi:MAG: extracellular solute-binding protein [Acidobacteriota bacterium]